MSTSGRRPIRLARRPGAAPGPKPRPHELVMVVTRLVAAQAVVSAVTRLAFSRGRLLLVLSTLGFAAALYGLAVLVRSGTHAAWTAAIAAESAFAGFGLVRFITSRYLGGTLLAFVVLGVLLYPAVASVFAGRAEPGYAEPALTEPGQS